MSHYLPGVPVIVSQSILSSWSSVWPKEWPFGIKSSSTSWFFWSVALTWGKVLVNLSCRGLPLKLHDETPSFEKMGSSFSSKFCSLVQSSYSRYSRETIVYQLETSSIFLRYLDVFHVSQLKNCSRTFYSWVDHDILDLRKGHLSRVVPSFL
jgi:hypothetical protein